MLISPACLAILSGLGRPLDLHRVMQAKQPPTWDLGHGFWKMILMSMHLISYLSGLRSPNAPNTCTGKEGEGVYAVPELEAPSIPEDVVEQKWFTHISKSDES